MIPCKGEEGGIDQSVLLPIIQQIPSSYHIFFDLSRSIFTNDIQYIGRVPFYQVKNRVGKNDQHLYKIPLDRSKNEQHL
jgi:hypothetical protein